MSQFIEAIRAGNLEVVRTFLDEHPEVVRTPVGSELSDARVTGMTPLHLAVETGRVGMVTLLVDAGADLGARNDEGRTALHDAVEYGMREIERLLIERGATIDVNLAAILGMSDRLRRMLDEDPSLANDRSTNLSPLGWASYGNRVDSAELLIEAGARMDDGELLCAASVGHAEVGELLIDRGFDVNFFHDGFGGTALHAAVAMRYTDDSSRFVTMILDRGADREIQAANGMTPLELARELERRQNATAPEHNKRFDRVIELLEG